MIELSLALVDCVKRGDFEAVEALLRVGADPNAVDLLEGVPVLHYATRLGDGRLAEMMSRFGAQPVEPPAQAPPVAPPPALAVNGVTEPAADKKKAGRSPARPPWAAPLAQLYRELGYVRRPQRGATGPAEDLDRLWEVRFIVSGKRDLRAVQEVLREAGFSYGEPVKLGGRLTQRVPGREAVERITGLLATGSSA